ncbi:hypothetical protein [Denitromonas sp.]|jgi:hypothetical protein|uniref:hypothetical protein n=1 Tax=Denitromonas sp. TaxID=2734609 RepID=UPI003A87FD59
MKAHTSEKMRRLLAQPGSAQFVREAIVRSMTSPDLQPVRIDNEEDGRSYEFQVIPTHKVTE